VLFAVCCQVQPAIQSQPKCLAACAAFGTLDNFLRRAADEGAISLDDPTGSGTALKLVPGIRLQAEQSGLMETFQAAMTAAATHLQHPCLQQQPAPAFADFSPIFYLCCCLTRGWTRVCQLWPEGPEKVAVMAIAAPAAVQLSAAIMLVVSRDLPAAVKAAAPEAPSIYLMEPASGYSPAVQESYASELCRAVFQVEIAMCFLHGCISRVNCIDPFSLPQLRSLATTPEYASLLATLLVVTSEALLAQQQLKQATAAASTPSTTGGISSSRSSANSSSNGSPGSSTVSHSRTATTNSANSKSSTSRCKSVHRWVKEASKDLPECTKALLEALGVDSTAVVWAAAAQRDQATFRFLRILTLA